MFTEIKAFFEPPWNDYTQHQTKATRRKHLEAAAAAAAAMRHPEPEMRYATKHNLRSRVPVPQPPL
jgi:hypothetical protein